MPGVLGWLYDYDNEEWRPARCDDGGRMTIKAIVDYLNDIEDVDVAAPTDGYVLYWDDAAGKWKAKAIVSTKIVDADADTKVDVEDGADEDIVRMDVAGVEAFHLSAVGILTLAKQSRARAHRKTTAQSMPEAWTKMEVNNESYDEQNEFDSTTNYRFTATEAGYYLCIVNAAIQMIADKFLWVSIWKNGVETATVDFHSSLSNWLYGLSTSVIYLAATDFIEGYVQHDCGGNRDMAASDTGRFSFVEVSKIG